jgi:multidrug efflux system membrane fusion protein
VKNMRLKKSTLKTHSVSTSFAARACLVTLAAVFVIACGKEEEKVTKEVVRPVKIIELESRGESLARKYPGKVQAQKRVDLAFQVHGPLIELPVNEGQEVGEGDLLARIDPRDFRTVLRNAEGQLAKAKAALDLAQSEYKRVLSIRDEDPGAVSGSMIDQKREAVGRAEADITSVAAAVDAAKDQLSYTYLRAPFDGVVAKRHVDNFQEVRAKQAIVSLDDANVIEIIIDVPETIMATVKKDRPVSKIVVEFASAPGKEYPLTVKEYATRADPTTQTYRITLQMPRPEDLNVLPGMTATVVGYVPEETSSGDQFVVPALAVFADEAGQAHVWVVDKDSMKVQQRKVTTGELTGSKSIQILEGLKSGEMIATTGVTQLREGMQVSDLGELEGYKP